MLTDEWFIGLSCTERGFWMQLILIAKAWGDTGLVTVRSRAAMGSASGLDGKSVGKFLGKFREDGKVIVDEQQGKFLTVKIVNYQYWQGFSLKKDGKNGIEKPTSLTEKSPLIEDRDITETETKRESKSANADYLSIQQSWNLFAEANGLARINSLTEKRKRSIRSRLAQDGFSEQAIYEKIKESKFLLGDNDRGWRCDFDFVWGSPDNWVKIVEGKYNNTKGSNNSVGGAKTTREDLAIYDSYKH